MQDLMAQAKTGREKPVHCQSLTNMTWKAMFGCVFQGDAFQRNILIPFAQRDTTGEVDVGTGKIYKASQAAHKMFQGFHLFRITGNTNISVSVLVQVCGQTVGVGDLLRHRKLGRQQR